MMTSSGPRRWRTSSTQSCVTSAGRRVEGAGVSSAQRDPSSAYRRVGLPSEVRQVRSGTRSPGLGRGRKAPEERRAQILDAAARLFVEGAVEDVSMAEIAWPRASPRGFRTTTSSRRTSFSERYGSATLRSGTRSPSVACSIHRAVGSCSN
jgi:hypothetical protein